jgi:hypothetical protein
METAFASLARSRSSPLVTRQSELWPEREQRIVQWVAPTDALSLIEHPELKALVAAFAKRKSMASKGVSSRTAARSIDAREAARRAARSPNIPDRRLGDGRRATAASVVPNLMGE